MGIGHWKKI